MSSSYRQRRCLRRGEGVGRLSWGVRGSIAAAWDVSGVATAASVGGGFEGVSSRLARAASELGLPHHRDGNYSEND